MRVALKYCVRDRGVHFRRGRLYLKLFWRAGPFQKGEIVFEALLTRGCCDTCSWSVCSHIYLSSKGMSGRSYKHEATKGKPHQNQETTRPKVNAQVANLSRLQRLLTKRIKRRNSCQKCDRCCEQFTWTDGLKRSQYIQYKYVFLRISCHLYIDIESKHIAVKIAPNLLKVNASRAIRIALLISIETSDPFASFQMHLRVIWHSSSSCPKCNTQPFVSVKWHRKSNYLTCPGQNNLTNTLFDQQSNALKYPHSHLNFSAVHHCPWSSPRFVRVQPADGKPFIPSNWMQSLKLVRKHTHTITTAVSTPRSPRSGYV